MLLPARLYITQKPPGTPGLAIWAEPGDNSICQLYGDTSERRATLHHHWCEAWLPAPLHASKLKARWKERSPGVMVCTFGW